MLSSTIKFILLLLPLTTSTATWHSSSSNGTSFYELLLQYGLPPGLLPITVTSFSHSEEYGQFVVNLLGECYVDFEHLVFYEPRITGVVSYGMVSQLKGIQVRRFLVWFDVDAIKVDLRNSEFVYFDVGYVTKKLRIDQFMTVHSCRSNIGLIDSVTNATQGLLSV